MCSLPPRRNQAKNRGRALPQPHLAVRDLAGVNLELPGELGQRLVPLQNDSPIALDWGLRDSHGYGEFDRDSEATACD